MSESVMRAVDAASALPQTNPSPRHSLLVTLVLAAAVSALLATALLFFAIDHFVSQQFEGLRAERMARELDALDHLRK